MGTLVPPEWESSLEGAEPSKGRISGATKIRNLYSIDSKKQTGVECMSWFLLCVHLSTFRVSLCALGVLLGLFVFTWVFGLLAVYGQPFRSPLPQLFESVFAILYATMGGFVFIIFCLNSKVGSQPEV